MPVTRTLRERYKLDEASDIGEGFDCLLYPRLEFFNKLAQIPTPASNNRKITKNPHKNFPIAKFSRHGKSNIRKLAYSAVERTLSL